MIRFYLVYVFLLFSILARSQQCAVRPDVDIPDNGRAYNTRIEANTTQSSNRILCGVRLSFQHEFADELRFVLQSPSGKRLVLIAGKSASSKTNGSTFNVVFIRGDNEAHPDDFKKPLWGDNKWDENQNYVGSYYPDGENGLEHFDGDRLTGTWNLNYVDRINGGKGRLISFELLFCEAPVWCNPCSVPRNFVSDRDHGSFCGGDPALASIQPTFINGNLTPGFLRTFLVVNGKNQIVSRGLNPDLRTLNRGNYRILGVQYRAENSALIDNVRNTTALNDLFYGNQATICGGISNASEKITILSNPGYQQETLEVYGRDFVVINGQRITTNQTVTEYYTDQNGCDSLVQIEVIFREYHPEFSQDHLYNCNHTSIGVSVSTEQNFEVQRWFTRDGKISNQSDIASEQIIVNAPGTYFVVFRISDYLDTVAYTLETDPTSPVITLSNEYTLCSSNPLVLEIGTNFDDATVLPEQYASIEGNILTITKPDLYTVSVSNGTCTLQKHLLVKPPETSESIGLEDAAITCPDEPVEVTPALSREYEHYLWSLDGELFSNNLTLTTNQSGFYTFQAFDEGQCGVSGTVWIEDQTAGINFQINGPELINCSNEGGDNRLIASFEGNFDVTWTLPDGQTLSGDEIAIGQDGTYSASLTDATGCSHTLEHEVRTNLETIDFQVPASAEIPCNQTSIQLQATVKAEEDSYNINWTGATRGNPKNTATVIEAGTVRVTVTHPESRCPTSKTIDVSVEDGKPDLTYDKNLDRNFVCGTPDRKIPITISDCENCNPVVDSTGDIKLENGVITANEPGSIRIALNNGACVSEFEIPFPDQRTPRSLNVNKSNIGCSGTPGRIEIVNKGRFADLGYVLDQGQDTIPYLNPINNISKPGKYVFVYTDTTNGCNDKQTIEVAFSEEPPTVKYEETQYLDCSSGRTTLTIRGDAIVRTVWYDQDGMEISDGPKQFVVSQPGHYRFIAFNRNDCYTEGTIEVVDDRSTPMINLRPQYELPCVSGQNWIIPLIDTSTLRSISWIGPGGWSSTEFQPKLDVGEYNVLVEGKNGCKTTLSTEVIRQTAGAAPDVIAPPITCQSDFSRVHLQNYDQVREVQWIDESGQASVSDTFDVYNPGQISLTIQFNSGCLVSKSLRVDEDKMAVPFTINKPIINCNNLNPVLRVQTPDSITRPIRYQWFYGMAPIGDQRTLDVEFPGDYKVAVSFDNGCVDTAAHHVELDTSAVTLNLRTDTLTCARSKIQLRSDINTGHIEKATWTGPEGFSSKAIRPNFQVPGIYTVTYAGKNGCEGTAEMEIYDDLSAPLVDSVGFLSLGCNDKLVDLTYFTQDSVTTRYWQRPDNQIFEDSIIQIDARGNYLLYLEGDNGCSKIDTFFIDHTVIPEFELEIQAAGCEDQRGKAIILPELDTFEAIWYEPGTMAELGRGLESPDLASGSYLVTVINPYNACDSTTVVEIEDISSVMAVELTIDDSIRCERSQANLISSVYPPSEHYVYEWRYGSSGAPISTDSVAENISREGVYTFSARDTINQCKVEGQYRNVRAPSRLRYFDLFLTEPACDINRAGFAIMDSLIGASDMSQVTYSVNNGSFSDVDTFPFLYANESYHILARDQYGCTLDTTLMPELRGIMDRVATIPDTTINSGDSIDFNDPAFHIQYVSADAPFSEQYTWILNPDTLSCDYDCVEPVQKQLFETRSVTAIMTNAYGCIITDTFQIYVREGDVLNVPNAIVPASANPANAHACVYTNQYVDVIELFVVFNRRGNVIFKNSGYSPRDPNQNSVHCWDGRDPKGNIHPPGHYNYYVKYRTVYGDTKEKYGNILLIR